MRSAGTVVMFGSGEAAATGRMAFDWLFKRAVEAPKVAILETPAGFEPNSADVAGRWADFITQRLHHHHPQVSVVPARKRGTEYSPNDRELIAPLLAANTILLGAGSPTYAARQLHGSAAWELVIARHFLGAHVGLASASAIAAGARVLPVYEIYKVGEELHWQPGLDLLGAFGLSLVIIPHWNNSEGGARLDTSRCFMGQERFAKLVALLRDESRIVGLEEHTALILDLKAETCYVRGTGGVVVAASSGEERRFERGKRFPINELGPFAWPPAERVGEQAAVLKRLASEAAPPRPPAEVLRLVDEREVSRARRDWRRADRLRDEIARRGWKLQDTPDGPSLEPLGEDDGVGFGAGVVVGA